MHGKFIMLIPMSKAPWKEVHMHFISSDLGILLSLMPQKRPFWDVMEQSMLLLQSLR
jgi:hypothetical protein